MLIVITLIRQIIRWFFGFWKAYPYKCSWDWNWQVLRQRKVNCNITTLKKHFYIELLNQRLLMLFPTQYKNLFRKRTSGMFLMSLFSVITSNFQLVWYNLSLFFLFEISFSFYLKEAFPCFINFKKFHLFVKKWSWQFFQAIMFCTFQWSLLIFVNYWSDTHVGNIKPFIVNYKTWTSKLELFNTEILQIVMHKNPNTW